MADSGKAVLRREKRSRKNLKRRSRGRGREQTQSTHYGEELVWLPERGAWCVVRFACAQQLLTGDGLPVRGELMTTRGEGQLRSRQESREKGEGSGTQEASGPDQRMNVTELGAWSCSLQLAGCS